MRGSYRETPLMLAAAAGHLEVMRCLLDAGAHIEAVNKWKRTALHAARTPEAVTLLLARGAAVDHPDEDGIRALDWAALWGAPHLLPALIEGGASLDRRRPDGGKTALHLAAEGGKPACTALLLAAGAEVDARDAGGSTPLIVAGRNGDAESVRLLLDHGAEMDARNERGQSALAAACDMGREAATRVLLEHGADLAGALPSSLRTAAIRTLLLEVPAEVARCPARDRRLLLAAARGDAAGVESALREGAALGRRDRAGRTALELAVAAGAAKAAILLEAGEIRRLRRRPADRDLLEAAVCGRLRPLRAALKAGARVDARDGRGHGPVDLAAEYGHDRVVQALLRAGASPDGLSPYGPLHWAAHNDHPAVIEALLTGGADRDRADAWGETPAFIAAAMDRPEVLRRLLLAGARHDVADAKGRPPLEMASGECARLLEEAASGRLLATERLRGTVQGPDDCPICQAIGGSVHADREVGESLPDAANRLERQRDGQWRCPACATAYAYERDRGWYTTGHEDDEYLSRR